MPQDDLEFDPTVEWLSQETPGRQAKPRRSMLLYLSIGGAMLLVTLTVIVATRQILRRVNPVDVKVSSHGLGNSAEMRAESVKAFQEFDAAADPLQQLSTEQQQERQAILDLFEKVQACARSASSQQLEEVPAPEVDPEEFEELVDYDRLTKRVELTGRIGHYSPVEKRYLRSELKKSIDVESYWARIVVANVLTTPDDPSTRVVYAFCQDSTEPQQSEVRFFIAWDGAHWKLYDWERLDLGVHVSEEWSIYAQYGNSSAMEGYVSWGEAIGETDRLILADDIDAAKEKIALAESHTVPVELEDRHWVLTAYRWQSLGDYVESQRCFEKVSHPEDVPGAYYGLMNCHRENDVQRALEYADLYEQSVGPSIDLCVLKASMFETMDQTDQAIEEWKKVLRIEPENIESLSEIFLALSEEDKPAIRPLLANLKNPAETLALLGERVGWEDYEGLLFLVKELEQIAPDAPATFHLRGLAKQQNGEFQAAADLYRQAFEAEADSEKIDEYANEYIEVMSRDGHGVAAWQSVPDPKSAFETLAYNYEDLETFLSADEFHEIADLYRQKFPDAIDGYYYSASQALEERRYKDAEKILRDGMLVAVKQTDDEENMIDADSLSSLLATALYELDRLREAYDVAGDRKQRFARLGQLATSKKQYDKVRELLEMHRKLEPKDPFLHYYAAELAAHEKQWEVALAELQAGLEIEPDNWQFKNRLREVSVESNRWLEYYTDSNEQKELFASLAQSFIDDQRWEGFYALVAEHRKRWPDDYQITTCLAEVAWEQENFVAYILHAEKLLQSKDSSSIPSYERESVEDRLLRSYLRTKNLEQARKLALKRQQTQYDSTSLAISEAASGELDEAARWAAVAASKSESASQLYSDEDVGHVFLSSPFSELHDKYPIENFYGIAPTSVIFIAEEPWQLEASDLVEAFEKAGISATASIKPLKSVRPDVTAAFVISLDNANIWVAAGTGKFNPDWKFEDETQPIAVTANRCSYWLAWGTAAWTQPRRKQVEDQLRSLAAQWTAGRAKAFYAKELLPWEEFKVFPATSELVNLWRTSGDMKSVRDEGLPIIGTYHDKNVAEDRRFESALREAAREFTSSPEKELELLANLSEETGVCTVRLKVTSLKRRYGDQAFLGTLVTTSELIPELRQGLNVLVDYGKIHAWRLNSDPPNYRSH